MNAREIIILAEVADDLNDGKTFYDQSEPGVKHPQIVPAGTILPVGRFDPPRRRRG